MAANPSLLPQGEEPLSLVHPNDVEQVIESSSLLPAGGEEQTKEATGLRELKARVPGAHSATETSDEIRHKASLIEQAKGSSTAVQPVSKSPVAGSIHPETTETYVPPRPPRETGSVLPINPRDYIMPSFRQLLASTPLGAIVPQLNAVIIARSNESIASVFEKLIQNKILSVPLLNVDTNQYVAFLDLLDILAYMVDTLGLRQRSNWPLLEHWMAQVQFQAPCIQLAHRSARNQWYVIARSQPLEVAMQQMALYNVHRLAVSDLENNFVSVLTQSRLVYWLSTQLNGELQGFGPLASLTMEDLKLGYRPVITIEESKLALEAFLLIQHQGVSGVAVIDQHRRLSGSISVSDLKDIGSTAAMFTKLFSTVGEFIRGKAEGGHHRFAYYVTQADTVRTVLELMSKYRIHRVFVVKSAADRSLIGVVSTNDVLALFDKVASE